MIVGAFILCCSKYNLIRIDPFMITADLHSSGTFMSGKMMISWENRDFINAFNCSMTSFFKKGYYTNVLDECRTTVIMKGSIRYLLHI